jgi:hypothetical protein
MFDPVMISRIKFFGYMSSLPGSRAAHAVCVTSDLALRKTLRRTLNAGGSTVEFVDDLDGPPVPLEAEAAMLFIDRACRRSTSVPRLTQVIGQGGKIIILGDSLEDDDVVQLLRSATVDHVISDVEGDGVELVVTSVKLRSGDIFGLEKYLAWGAKVHELEINTYEQKRTALMTVAQHAKEVGARRHVVGKIESVTDELLMNALYDAPAVSRGLEPQHASSLADISTEHGEESALVRYACDGRYFALSVQDNYGQLHKEAILDHLVRARAERGAPKLAHTESATGAGLGLYFILSSVTRFIANIEKGNRTEVVCLFDLKESGRDAASCARSLHIFTV